MMFLESGLTRVEQVMEQLENRNALKNKMHSYEIGDMDKANIIKRRLNRFENNFSKSWEAFTSEL